MKKQMIEAIMARLRPFVGVRICAETHDKIVNALTDDQGIKEENIIYYFAGL